MSGITENLTPQELAVLLGTSYPNLKYLLYKSGVQKEYTVFEVPKKTGGVRLICAPSPRLKNIQRTLASKLDELYVPRSSTMGFVKGRSVVDNAQMHTKRSYVFNIDLEDFFGSINFGRVRGLLSSPPYSIPLNTATLIAQICCYNNALAQGAPTSPVLSNMICKRLDRELKSLAVNNKAFYSRYVDDITFSFQGIRQGISGSIVGFVGDQYSIAHPGAELEQIIQSNGFRINPLKTRVQSKHQKQVVTGLVVNKKVNVDRRFVRDIRARLHYLGRGKFDGVGRANVEYSIYGSLLYLGMVKGRNSSVYLTLASKFNDLGIRLKMPMPKLGHKNQPVSESLLKAPFLRSVREKVWVITCSIPGSSGEMLESQGTGFMLSGNILVTAAHVVGDGFDFSFEAMRVGGDGKKYSFSIAEICHQSDIAILSLDLAQTSALAVIPEFPHLELADSSILTMSNRLAVCHFAQYHGSFNAPVVNVATVTLVREIQGHRYFDVDATIRDGASGAPVCNQHGQVVGMIVRGWDKFDQGMNAFIGSQSLAEIVEPDLVLELEAKPAEELV